MSKIFIYYSFSGNGDYIANALKEKGYEIRKVIPQKSLPKALFPCMMVGGFQAMTKKKAKLIDYDSNIDGYDEVVIGGPIWNDRISSPINTVLYTTSLENKKLTFLLYSGGGEAKSAYKRLKKLYPNSMVIILKQPKDNPDEIIKLKEL